ncbi:hypothetical protein CTAYLR_005524 [Chrysophaeum taylorii]|uniref:Carboxypeptidase n=1 Tax=Chrysophaeum taylorii TaxID=2483200 RepID=A0AAD7XHB7_9STRA|nr:hypothetical protein CTAYLR_005524 [Chrysophaeum taylorii]
MLVFVALVVAPVVVMGAPAADKVTSLPGFEDSFDAGLLFEVYSGYLDVDLTGAGLAYDALKIHYEFHTCVKSDCPVAVWHQGGPGGSSVYGAWTEMGPFQVMASGTVENFALAWNNVANMLYLESPAGSYISEDDLSTGWSSCYVSGKKMGTCEWSDTTQAVAYARTLAAFYDAFPEFKANDLYLVGESYAGQYIPNIATYLVENPTVLEKNLSGIAVGNGCWGGSENVVVCNGKNAEKHDVEIYYGKGLISDKLYDSIVDACGYSFAGASCSELLVAAEAMIGPYNIYNVYDDCELTSAAFATNASLRLWYKRFLRAHPHVSKKHAGERLAELAGETYYASGYPWNCESDPALDVYFTRDDVLDALHLNESGSSFSYSESGPASHLLYPSLVKHMRVLIYNGDADLCVPYKGNEQWTVAMATDGYVDELKPWHPWYTNTSAAFHSYAPAGYATTYTVPDKVYTNTGGNDFAFITIRLAGHMVPQYQPKPALSFFTRFLAGDTF